MTEDITGFKQAIKKGVEGFKKWDNKETIRIISHLDSDGISACAIIVKALNRNNNKYSISILPQLTIKLIEEFERETYKNYIFTDLGSSNVDIMKDKLKNKNIIILDHHKPKNNSQITENIIHINPHHHGIDGGKEISGSGVVYFFCKELDNKNIDMAHIAIVGAIGDVQEDNGFRKLNQEILKDAIQEKKIKEQKGLKLFGTQTRPIHKILEYNSDLAIPGVTGSESGAIQFLYEIGIDPKKGNYWKMISDLTEEEMKKLCTGLIVKRANQKNPEDIFGTNYILPNEEEGPFRDAREFSTLLNACGRLNKASLGIGACIGDEKIKQKAIANMKQYKGEIVKAMQWYKDNIDNKEYIIKEKGFIIINAQDNVLPTMIGTLGSILSKGHEFPQGTYVLTLAINYDHEIKASLRIAGRLPKGTDLKAIMNQIIQRLGTGETGGHENAAGALLPVEKEKEFIEIAKEILAKSGMEEVVE